MKKIIYVYDVKKGKHKDPRRTQFNKLLFGFRYRWETREGQKTRLRQGLIHIYNAKRIGDSVISVLTEYEEKFDELFENYIDIFNVRKFLVEKELQLIKK
ncbi:MAG: hypothetical protein ACTSQY_05165 [Candidatus Odinarchaeia archaeon]